MRTIKRCLALFAFLPLLAAACAPPACVPPADGAAAKARVSPGAESSPLSDPLVPASVPPGIGARSAVLADAATGTVLFSLHPNLQIPPASLTKLMTIHLVLEEIAAGRAFADEILVPPEESWAQNQAPRSSLMFLGRNQRVSLGELLLGLAVSSGNDAATAAALRFAPTVEDFVSLMNAEAAALGLSSTRFADPAGLSGDNTTTAADFARFCSLYIAAHPESPALLHSVREFAYPLAANMTAPVRAPTIVQNNFNSLLGRFEGVDGLKTGHIPEAGYNIALTARRGGTRLVAVVLGADSEKRRAADGEALLSWGFDNFETIRPPAPEFPPARIWKGKEKYAELELEKPPVLSVSKNRAALLSWELDINAALEAPLPKGARAGTLVLRDETGELLRAPLLLKNAAPKGGFWRSLFDSIGLVFI
ncbi:MAG: D-alanyl-D-alanine carboxypeptidase [Treponema sp.]|jgi:D-alanyl-D-alanine carboxypeptidase (penicillin-binding protein 5/6)|nr:D-alanyl-D-alanine carboxypeptidase [Treponema sp.]